MAADKHSFSLRLEPELHRALNALAGVRSISLSKLISDLLTEGWENAPEKEGLAKILSASTKKSAGDPKKEEKKTAPVEAGSVTKAGFQKAPKERGKKK